MQRFVALFFALLLAAPSAAQEAPADKSARWPMLSSGSSPLENLDSGPELQRGRTAKWLLEDNRRMSKALAGLLPQRKGVVDAYVVSIALDSDPVFGREAREAANVLTRRFDAAGRSIILAGNDRGGSSSLPNGSVMSLSVALARVAELMDPAQDVLILYATTHGTPQGLVYHDGNNGYGLLSPRRLKNLLDELGIKNRLLIVSACYAGVFGPAVSDANTFLLTAASSDRPSFGCVAENDWTFFGDALINHALRKPLPLADAADEARLLISGWESGAALPPSRPQVAIGANVATWLTPLESRMPKLASQPIGKPSIDSLKGE